MVIDEWYVSSGDDAGSEPAAVQRVHGGHCGCYRWTLAIHVALWRSLVYIHVKHSTMLIAFADYVVTDFYIPVGI